MWHAICKQGCPDHVHGGTRALQKEARVQRGTAWKTQRKVRPVPEMAEVLIAVQGRLKALIHWEDWARLASATPLFPLLACPHPRHALEQKKWKEQPPPPPPGSNPPQTPQPSPSSNTGGSLSRGPGEFLG